MSPSIKRLHWLRQEHDAALLAHAICGDQIAPPDPHSEFEWFTPTAVSRGSSILMLRFENPGAAFALCAAAPASLSVEWVARMRAALSPAGAEQRWAPFVGQLGRYQDIASARTPLAWSEAEMRHGRHWWRTRRARHPSALIDRLSARDRMEAELRVHAAFAGDVDEDVGVFPQSHTPGKVGDRRAE